MKIREKREILEKQILSPYATLSINSKGRKQKEDQCPVRTIFQRDRDRIIHSKSFRRLKYKTQVFIAPEGDHYRTRLTHTLEVSQIARTLARALNLNEDLTEAIALGHDLGHTPFGHTGENVLDEICSFGFEHNKQSLRVVDELEKGTGLNLSWEVKEGIRYHSGETSPKTLEGKIVHFSDRIAYINHDIDDAIRGNVISLTDLPKDCINILGDTHSKRINKMITDIIKNSIDRDNIFISPIVGHATDKLRDFLFKNVYIESIAKKEEEKARNIIKSLFEYFIKHLNILPEEYKEKLEYEDMERIICDYIAGMTDRYAINLYTTLFIPTPWKIY